MQSKNWRCDSISKIKRELTIYTIIGAALAALISLPIIGFRPLFFYGLALGTAIAIVDLHLHARIIESFTAKGHRGIVTAGFFVRFAILGIVFYISVRNGLVSGAGTAIGFILPKIAMYVSLGILPVVKKKLHNEPSAHYEVYKIEQVFMKQPWMERFTNGTLYKTHRKLRKVRIVNVEEGDREE